MCSKAKIDEEFEEFFFLCQKVAKSDENELRLLLRPLRNTIWREQSKKYLKILLTIATICSAVFYIDTLNWYFCGISRILMIKLLPWWDWTTLARARCLVAKSEVPKNSPSAAKFLDEKDCRACQHFEKLPTLEDTTYSHIRDNFLIRGLPAIVTDTKTNFDTSTSLKAFIDRISANFSEIMQEEPCNFETNLMISQYATLLDSFSILKTMLNEGGGDTWPWFISFRNCRFRALKASRLLMPKPYFYPRNLQSPASSWLLMSQNFPNYQNDLKLYGLVMVTQLKGTLNITLKAKDSCYDLCKDISFRLYAGETLTYLSNLWIFSYAFSAEKDFTATIITETDFY